MNNTANTCPRGVQKTLTESEKTIALHVCQGFSNKEIADLIGRSPATVRTHIEHIYNKCDVDSRVELVVECLKSGVFTLEQL